MDAPVSPLYLLERFDVGVIELDAERRVVAMNDFARRVLPVAEKQPFDRMVLNLHPERSQPKVDFLLAQAAQSATCPVSNPPPMAMIINIPERVLLIKVTRMAGADGATRGYVLVFYEARLYSDLLLQLVYVVLQAYGWWLWLAGGRNRLTMLLYWVGIGKNRRRRQ